MRKSNAGNGGSASGSMRGLALCGIPYPPSPPRIVGDLPFLPVSSSTGLMDHHMGSGPLHLAT